jgi:hypothetical protein
MPFTTAASGMTDTEITEVFNRVSEDYRPFNINITTDSTVYKTAPINSRIRIVVTPTSSWYPGVGGVAYVSSFTWGDDTPGFVFNDRLGIHNAKMVAEACSHESGHTLGLYHQSRYDAICLLTETYNSGSGTGETSWAPVMGNSYYRNITGWNNGPIPAGCILMQDNLSIITTQNGFTYRTDDYAEAMNASTKALTASNINVTGIITKATDKDAFKIILAKRSTLHIDAKPYSVGANDDGADLDIELNLYNANGKLIKKYSPAAVMSVTIDTTLATGTYYILLSGTGNDNTSNYGVLGSYTITGKALSLASVRAITLKATSKNKSRTLDWQSIPDSVRSIALELTDKTGNFNLIKELSTTLTTFTVDSLQNEKATYRLKVVLASEEVIYSNPVQFLKDAAIEKSLVVPTFVQSYIVVQAADKYTYQLSSISGNLIATGYGAPGNNRINISNQPAGMYIIQLYTKGTSQTERIIKQ